MCSGNLTSISFQTTATTRPQTGQGFVCFNYLSFADFGGDMKTQNEDNFCDFERNVNSRVIKFCRKLDII